MVRDEIIEAVDSSQAAALTADDVAALRKAKQRLEHPSLAARIADLVGRPLESGLRMLPSRWHRTVASATEAALRKGLEFSIKTMGRPEPRRSRDWMHKALVAGTGAIGGAVGMPALSVELPLSTCIMLRSIADIARSEGHDLSLIEVRLACLEVFALGGAGPEDDAAESGYWIVRGALSKYISDAANHIATRGLADKSAPALVRLAAQIASRLGVVVSEQAAAQLLPIVGAVTGGAVNYLFMEHFQEVAGGHFVVKRLEKKYGTALVRKAYDGLTV